MIEYLTRAARFSAKPFRLACFAMVLMCCPRLPLFSQEEEGADAAKAREFSKQEIALPVLLGAGIHLGAVVETFWSDKEWMAPVCLATLSAQNLPSLGFTPESTGANLVVQAGLDAAWAVGHYAYPREPVLDSVLFNAAHKFSYYAAYDSYARSRLAESGGAGDFRQYGLAELATAPFDPAVLKDWRVWGEIGVRLAIAGIRIALADKGDSVWQRGSAYLGDHELDPAIGIPLMLLVQTVNFTFTAIGEECLFRGVYYEEGKRWMGVWPSRIAAASAFTLVHYPQNWSTRAAQPLWRNALEFCLSTANGVWWESVYDDRGLPAVVAVHAWADVIGFGADWLLSAGVPTVDGQGLRIQ